MADTVETIAEQLFYTTVYIETWSAEANSSGTGFLVNYATAEGDRSILVTNKHVFEGAHTACFRTVAMDNDGQPSSESTQIEVTNFDQEGFWLGHPDPKVDVAVMLFTGIQVEMVNIGAPSFTRAFGPELLLTSEQAKELDAIEDVLFVGYPAGLYDTASWLPIARRGQTATPIRNDYQGMPAFLIDASVFPGSSGSPVVLYDRGMPIDRQGNMYLGERRFHLIGVIAAVHTREVRGEIILAEGTPTARFDDVLNLGIVFKASAIQECVDKLMENLSLTMQSAPEKQDLA